MQDLIESASFIRVFVFLCLFTFLIIFSSNYILISDEMFFQALGNQLSYERIASLIESNKKWSWVIYPLTPFLFILKFFIVVLCLYVGTFLFNVDLSVKSLFKITVLGEFIFLFPSIVKLFWFGLFQTSYTLSDLQYFSLFSLLSVLDSGEVEGWLLYPLQVINLFEVLYWLFIAHQIRILSNISFAVSLKFVASTYGVGLLLWVIFVMFLTLNLM